MSMSQGTRRGLRPDTFPFLAVLLCAMGSLILLLLVMDRRAKAVARAKALLAVERLATEDAKVTAARQEEWERRRAALREALLQQATGVQDEIKDVQDALAKAAAGVRLEQGRRQELAAQVRRAQAALVERENAVTAEKQRLVSASRQAGALQTERSRLAAELEQVERTLADLKTLRQRQQQTYSVVPYRGKHGDNRKPLYVEVTAAGLVFHPERKLLASTGAQPLDIRKEVEQRLPQQGPPQTGSNPKPYLLLLVRPDGIQTYYLTQAALAGLDADFGYEFIDRDWLLDFPEDNTPSRPALTRQPEAPARAQHPLPFPGFTPQHDASARTQPSNPATRGQAQPGASARAGTAPPATFRADAPATGGPGTGSGVTGSRPASPVGAAVSGVGSSLTRTSPGGSAGGQPGTAASGVGSTGLTSTNPVGSAGGQPASRGGQPALPGATVGSGAAPREQTAPQAPPSMLGSPVPAGSSTSGGSPSTAPTPGGLTGRSDGPAVTRRSSTRDWVIAVECRSDAFLVYPGATRIALATLAAPANGENVLLKAVRQEVERRQALVRPSEAAYQPHVRFLVRPDGARAYYRAFPVLEALGVPMSRQNLDAEEAVGLEHLTR